MIEVSDGMVAFTTVMIGFSFLLFIVGLIRPRWILFWMEEPNRLMITALAMVMFMGFVTWHSSLTMKSRNGTGTGTSTAAESRPGITQSRDAPESGGGHH